MFWWKLSDHTRMQRTPKAKEEEADFNWTFLSFLLLHCSVNLSIQDYLFPFFSTPALLS